MHLSQFICLLLLILASHTTRAEDDSSTESNEIIPREAIQKLDFSVRQALLRAIDKLEQEAAAEKKQESSTTATTLTKDKDEILEESTNAADVVPTVQFYTATFDDKSTQEQLLSSFIDRSKTWKKPGKKLQPSFGSPSVVEEVESKTATVQRNQQNARSVGGSVRNNEISAESHEEIKFEIRKSKETPTTTTTRRPRTRPTTTTTTTTTTPRPTHNEDGENIEVVDKGDVRIQEAPLVTAFTVNLDERGTANKVVPIVHSLPTTTTTTTTTSTLRSQEPFHTHVGPTIAKLSVLPGVAPAPTQLSTTASTFLNVVPTGNFITKQSLQFGENTNGPTTPSNVNNFLIERQRQLEQQIYQLKLQAQQQQELIFRQLKLLEEQTKFGSNQRGQNGGQQQQQQQQQQQLNHQHNQQQQQLQQSQPLPQPQQLLSKKEPVFTIRPSIEFLASHVTKTITPFQTFPGEQQLPLKEASSRFSFGNSINTNFTPPNNLLHTQQLPAPNPVQQIFQKLQSLQTSNTPPTPNPTSSSSVQAQPFNQFNFSPAFSNSQPLELSHFQPLPQRNYQLFQQQQLVPSFGNGLLQQQPQQQPLQHHLQQQQPQAAHQQGSRIFRQETGTSNLGINQVQIQPSTSFAPIVTTTLVNDQQLQQQNIENQNFYRQHLQPQLSNQLQQNAQNFFHQQHQQQQQPQNSSPAALNHGIPAFAPHNQQNLQNLRPNGGF